MCLLENCEIVNSPCEHLGDFNPLILSALGIYFKKKGSHGEGAIVEGQPLPGWVRQEECKFQASLGNLASPCSKTRK